MSWLSEQHLLKGQTFNEVPGNAPRFPRLRTIVLSLKCNSGGGFYSVCEPTFRFPKGKLHLARVPRPSDVGIFNMPPGTYSPNTFLTSPIFRWTFPLTFSAVPRSRRFGSPAVFPTSSFTLPLASLILPFALSFVLDFILTIRASANRRLAQFKNGKEKRNGRSTIPHASSI